MNSQEIKRCLMTSCLFQRSQLKPYFSVVLDREVTEEEVEQVLNELNKQSSGPKYKDIIRSK